MNWLLVSNLLIISMVAEIIFVFVPRGKISRNVYKMHWSKARSPQNLRAAFDDPVVHWAHRWEEISLVVIIFLMVTKPF